MKQLTLDDFCRELFSLENEMAIFKEENRSLRYSRHLLVIKNKIKSTKEKIRRLKENYDKTCCAKEALQT